MARPKLITAPVDDATYERVKFYCDKTGKKISDFARDCVIAALPKNLMAVMDGKEESFLASMQAHDVADAIDGVAPLKVPAQNTPGDRAKTYGVPGHPCINLRAEFSPPFDSRTSQGTCYAPTERGRACFWYGMSARQCPSFRAK